ncbi:tRNA (adenosine(37)-N6)-threonylcarbamoyltransferase complex transferase subunit TsaD [Fusibacter sp. JL216-2]|uniref:tRNA (adenosine(37)-N6)-threonylcarbamoyltransferase complex transferase subunit TsaD n=1 Tax=Fusibacter sp. JL216-2 TaxID=3071453 RepID=UPI003D352416
MSKDLLTLAIETSCDETSAAVLQNGRTVLSNIVYSQIDIHKKFGGVVPEIASRNHVEKISQVIDEALVASKKTFDDMDMIAVTYGPGLVGALLVGVSTAKALAFALDKPLVPVNHIEGHICANFIEFPDLEPPFVCLIVSGGHSHLVHVKEYGNYEILGRTRDDAAGEAFDKVARTLGLGYPGGPKIDKLAEIGNPEAVHFPRAFLEKGSLDFSFSGLKSAVLNHLNQCKMKDMEVVPKDIAASFQASVVEVLTTKAIMAAKQCGVDKIVLAGGVAANNGLRQSLTEAVKKDGLELYYPSLGLCTDNAAMVGCAGYYDFLNGVRGNMALNAVPNLKLGVKP